MCELTDWILGMETTKEGKATLANMLYDIQNQRLSEAILREFFRELEQLWSAESNQDPVQVFCKAQQDHETEGEEGYSCQGPSVPLELRECSRVMDIQVLFRRNIVNADTYWPRTGQPLSRQQVRQLEQPNLSAEKGTGEMRTKRPFAWVTQTASLNAIRATSDSGNWATVIGNRLGLEGSWEPVELVEVRYPEAVMREQTVAAPTFLEGEPLRPYRSLSTEDKWGRTVDLATGASGLPEAVHPPVSFGQGFSLKYIGLVTSLESYDKQSFLEQFPLPWSNELVGDLMRQISGLL